MSETDFATDCTGLGLVHRLHDGRESNYRSFSRGSGVNQAFDLTIVKRLNSRKLLWKKNLILSLMVSILTFFKNTCPFYLYQEKQVRHIRLSITVICWLKRRNIIAADVPYFTVYSLFIHGDNTKHILSLQCYISFCRTVFMSCIPLINYGKLSRPDSLPLSWVLYPVMYRFLNHLQRLPRAMDLYVSSYSCFLIYIYYLPCICIMHTRQKKKAEKERKKYKWVENNFNWRSKNPGVFATSIFYTRERIK